MPLIAATAAALGIAGGSSAGPGSASGLIAFSRGGSIYAVSADGTGLRVIARRSSASEATEYLSGPTWSPTGKRLVYVAGERGDIIELWLRQADGSGARRLRIESSYVYDPVSWSPTGRYVAFDRLETVPTSYGGNTLVPWIFRAGLDSRLERALARPPHPGDDEIGDSYPAWSPTGDVIAFERGQYRGGAPATIYLVRGDGRGELVRLTQGHEPDWSPDGQGLTFARNGDVYTINRDGTGLRRLTRTPGRESSPEWGPNGAAIAFVRRGTVWIIGANGRTERRVIGNASGPIDWQQRVP